MDTYYHPHDLSKFADMGKGNTALWDKFMSYYSAVFAEGALTEREKALIALAVAHTVQCPYCIDAYTQASLEKGSNVEEMTEAVRGLCHPGRSLTGARCADAECEREAVHVETEEWRTSVPAGCSKTPVARPQGAWTPKAYGCGYVEADRRLRTQLGAGRAGVGG